MEKPSLAMQEGLEQIILGNISWDEEELDSEDFEDKATLKRMGFNAFLDMANEYLTVLNKYYDEDAIFSQKFWLREKMLGV